MKKVFEQVSLEDLPKTAEQVVAFAEDISIWKFEGNLGAGKTTLIKELCKQLGVQHPVQSPTFSIVNVYQSEDGEDIFHFDCYRLKNEEEAYDFGVEEYFYSGNICLVEWPQVIDSLLPVPHLLVKIDTDEYRTRRIELEIINQ